MLCCVYLLLSFGISKYRILFSYVTIFIIDDDIEQCTSVVDLYVRGHNKLKLTSALLYATAATGATSPVGKHAARPAKTITHKNCKKNIYIRSPFNIHIPISELSHLQHFGCK